MMNKTKEWALQQLFDDIRRDPHTPPGTIHTVTAKRANFILKKLAQGELPEEYPAQIQVNLTTQCSRKRHPAGDCINCSFPTDRSQHIEINKLLIVLKQFSRYGGRSLFLSGGGEPGSYQNLEELITFLAEDPDGKNLELTLNTHGTFIKRMNRLAQRTGQDGVAWRRRLKTIFSGRKLNSNVLSMISVSWHDDSQAVEAINMLSSLRDSLDLRLIIRASSLVYSDPETPLEPKLVSQNLVGSEEFNFTTSIAQIEEIIHLAHNAGADLLSFKPAHVYETGFRAFVTNDPVHNLIKNKVDAQRFQGAIRHWDSQSLILDSNFAMLLEESPRLNRLKSSYRKISTELAKKDISCIAPLVTLFLSLDGFAACCDTWDHGLGNTPPFVLTDTLEPPRAHYMQTLYWMIRSIRDFWPTRCVLGCGWTELNVNNPLNLWARDLRVHLDELHTDYVALWNQIIEHYRTSLQPSGICPNVPVEPYYRKQLSNVVLLESIKTGHDNVPS